MKHRGRRGTNILVPNWEYFPKTMNVHFFSFISLFVIDDHRDDT